jgi:hypothetical protein
VLLVSDSTAIMTELMSVDVFFAANDVSAGWPTTSYEHQNYWTDNQMISALNPSTTNTISPTNFPSENYLRVPPAVSAYPHSASPQSPMTSLSPFPSMSSSPPVSSSSLSSSPPFTSYLSSSPSLSSSMSSPGYFSQESSQSENGLSSSEDYCSQRSYVDSGLYHCHGNRTYLDISQSYAGRTGEETDLTLQSRDPSQPTPRDPLAQQSCDPTHQPPPPPPPTYEEYMQMRSGYCCTVSNTSPTNFLQANTNTNCNSQNSVCHNQHLLPTSCGYLIINNNNNNDVMSHVNTMNTTRHAAPSPSDAAWQMTYGSVCDVKPFFLADSFPQSDIRNDVTWPVTKSDVDSHLADVMQLIASDTAKRETGRCM